MKKWLLSIVSLAFVFALAACSEANNASDIYTKAIEAAEEMESAEVSIEMKQEMKVPGEENVMKTESKMEGSIMTEPVAMHQKGVTSINLGEMTEGPMEMEQELYYVNDEMYMFESMTNQWMKLDTSILPLDMVNNQQMDVSEQLDMVKEHVEDLSLSENDESYLLSLKVDGDAVKSLSEKLLKEMIPEDVSSQFTGDVMDVFENMNINELSIEMTIDKKSYQMTQYNMMMDMSMNIEGQELNIAQDVKTTYKNINTIEAIEVPQEVLDSAVEAPSF